MRTVLTIEDELLTRARERASESAVTLDEYVEMALRRELASARSARRAVVLTVSAASGGARPGVDLTTNRGLYDSMGVEGT